MTAVARMSWFHTRRLWATSFFVQLLVLSTAQIVCLQALPRFAELPVSGDAWIRASLVGIWMVSTVSAGIIGFQRFQGTLVHLVRSPRPAWQAITPVVVAASSMGLFSVPLALFLATIFGLPMEGLTSWRVLAGLVMFWLGSAAMSALIANLFVLSRYATTYEDLIGGPLVLLSGIFGHPGSWTWFEVVNAWLPTAWAVRLIFDQTLTPQRCLGWSAVCLFAWGAAAGLLGGVVLRKATRTGTLDVI